MDVLGGGGQPKINMMKEDEIKNNVVTVKNMETGNQETVKIEEAIEIIKR